MDATITWAALFGAVTLQIALIGFLWKFWGDNNAKIEEVRKDANDKIDEVERTADKKVNILRAEREKAGADFSAQFGALQGQLSLTREQIQRDQREFITREMLRELETRMERSQTENTNRISDALKALTDRIDRLTEGRQSRAAKR